MHYSLWIAFGEHIRVILQSILVDVIKEVSFVQVFINPFANQFELSQQNPSTFGCILEGYRKHIFCHKKGDNNRRLANQSHATSIAIRKWC